MYLNVGITSIEHNLLQIVHIFIADLELEKVYIQYERKQTMNLKFLEGKLFERKILQKKAFKFVRQSENLWPDFPKFTNEIVETLLSA